MTRSVYIVGGAGTGKSTFTAELLSRLGAALGPLDDLHKTPNARGTQITLRGHEMKNYPRWKRALYLGCMRESFPGTDGLDRASSITGEAWLERGGADAYDFILAEGATLATRRFITALQNHTELLLVHLTTEDWLKELRLEGRGSNQADTFILGTATRSANLVRDMRQLGAQILEVDTGEMYDWGIALDTCEYHLLG